jgi:hypothetical protein
MSTLTINKETVKELLSDFPEKFAIGDFIDRIIIASKLDKALEQLDSGEYLTESQLDDEIKKWDSRLV